VVIGYAIYDLVKKNGFTLQGAKEKYKSTKELNKNRKLVENINKLKFFLLTLKNQL